MTLRYFVPDLQANSRHALSAEEARHALSVMRLRVGDHIHVFDGKGYEAEAELVECDRRSALIFLCHAPQPIDRERHPAVHLAIALPKGERQKWLLEKVVELGATSLTPIHAERSVAKIDSDAIERLERGVIEACKQCGRNRLMDIYPAQSFSQYLARPFSNPCQQIIAHPGLGSVREQHAGAVIPLQETHVLIGPEGGFSDQEVALATERGWKGIDLGKRILRTETAALAILATL